MTDFEFMGFFLTILIVVELIPVCMYGIYRFIEFCTITSRKKTKKKNHKELK